MQAFELCIPTKIIFGESRVSEVGKLAKQYGDKLLMVYGMGSIKKNGSYDKVVKSLSNAGIKFIEHPDVKSNPVLSHTIKGVEIVKKQNLKLILAVGGGSVMDEAKAISIGACTNDNVWDLATGKAEIKASLPVITVVTIPATSSEMNATSVLTNEQLNRKEGFANAHMYPKLSILDPELTYSISLKQTAYSAADIISHIFEGYLTHNDNFVPMQNRYCENIIKTIIECMDILIKDSKEGQARAMMMWAAAYTWNGFYVSGIGRIDNPIHILGHSFSAFYDIPHGAAMSITILATMRYHLSERKERYARFAREVFNISDEEDIKAAQKGIDLLEEWFKKIGTPINFKEAGIPEDSLDVLAEDALVTAKMWGLDDLWSKERAMGMLKLCI